MLMQLTLLECGARCRLERVDLDAGQQRGTNPGPKGDRVGLNA
jgi:hypothetical protein